MSEERKPILKVEYDKPVVVELMFDSLKTFQGKKWQSEELEDKFITVLRLVNDYDVYKGGQEVSFFPTRLTGEIMNKYIKGSKLRINKIQTGSGDQKRTKYEVDVVEGKMKDFDTPSSGATSTPKPIMDNVPNAADVIKKGETHLDLTEEESASMSKVIKWTMERGTILNIFDFKNKWTTKFPDTDDTKLQKIYGIYEFTFKFAKVKF